jgi:glycogen debranching enzyme
MEIEEQAFEKAKVALKKCATPHGMHASGGRDGYNMVFSRDSMIGLIGVSVVDSKKEFKNQFRLSLNVLGKYQSKTGQIPNAVDKWDKKRVKQATFATLDSTLWWLLGLKAFTQNYKDKSLLKKYKKAVNKAFFWLRCQDSGEDGMPEQHPTSDWQDCFPHKYGHTINTVALYYAALKAFGKKSEAKRVKASALGSTSPTNMIYKKEGYFWPWRWKDHDGELEAEKWFDSLGNLLAICSGLADKKQTKRILDFIEKKGISKPFPIKAMSPPIKKGSKEWQPYFSKCLAAKPNYYLNGGIWPYIGGFYVAALVKAKRFTQAKKQLKLLAEVNRLGAEKEWEFNEWVHPLKKKAMGSSYHAWSGGAYLLAFKSVSDKKIAFF